MSLQEFKAWLEGFLEGINETPNKEQFQAIKDRLKTVREPSIHPAAFAYPKTFRSTPEQFYNYSLITSSVATK